MQINFRHLFSVYLIFICLPLLSACGDDLPPMPTLGKDAVILAFGDSLTYGNGAGKNQSYPARLEVLSGRRVINAGISGEVSEKGLRRLPGLLETHQPQLVILCHGGNDMLRKKSMSEMESNLRRMIQLSKQQGAEVILIGVPKPGLFLSSFEVYEKIAQDTDVVFIEDLIPDVLGDKALKSDTVHPNSEGYRVMAETIYAELQARKAL